MKPKHLSGAREKGKRNRNKIYYKQIKKLKAFLITIGMVNSKYFFF
jgi:hypothetical protein